MFCFGVGMAQKRLVVLEVWTKMKMLMSCLVESLVVGFVCVRVCVCVVMQQASNGKAELN